MDRAEFATRLRKRLPEGSEGDRAAAEILADADDYAAWGIEQCAHPHYIHWVKPARKVPAGPGEKLAVVTELPGGEQRPATRCGRTGWPARPGGGRSSG